MAAPVTVSDRQASPSRPRRAMLAIFAAVSAVYLAASIAEPAGIYDEGLIVSGAARILRGEHPYVDFNSGYPPGQFYTVALLFRLFGSTLLVERVWDTLWRAAIVAAALWLAGELSGKRFRLLPLAICPAVLGALGFRLYPMVTATLPCLCALASALRFERTRDPRWIFGSGILLGATALYRHDLAACVGLVVFLSVARDRRALGWLAAGTLLVLGPAAAYLLATVPRPWLVQAFIEFPALNAAARRLPLPSAPYPLIRDVLLPVAIFGAALFEARRAPAATRKPLIMLAGLGLLLVALASQRIDTAHIFPALILCAVILARADAPNRLRAVLVAFAVLFYAVAPAAAWAYNLQTVRRTPASGIAAAGPVRIAPDQARAVRYILDHVPPGDALYVGSASHSRICLNDAIFAFLAERRPASRYAMWLPGETNAAPAQSAIVHALESAPVHWAVLFDAPASVEPNLSSVDSGVTILDSYLARNYRQIAVFGSYRILERTAEIPPR